MQTILLLKQTLDSTDRAQVLDFGDESSAANLGSFRDVVYGHDEKKSLEFLMQFELQEELSLHDTQAEDEQLIASKDLGIEVIISPEDKKRIHVASLKYSLGDASFLLKRTSKANEYELETHLAGFKPVRKLGRKWPLPKPIKFYGFPDQVYSYFQNASFLNDLQLKLEDSLRKTYYLGPLREFPLRRYIWNGAEPSDMGHRGEKVVDALLASRNRERYISLGRGKTKKTLEEMVAYWLKELGLIHSFEVKEVNERRDIFEVKVQKTPNSSLVYLTDVGFGVSQLLPIIALCYYVPEGSTILLEQPEIHLHPAVQSGLADLFIHASKWRNVQIIFESHSEHLLRRLQRRIAEEEIQASAVAIYFCEFVSEETKISPLNLDEFGNIKNWPKDFFGDQFGEVAETQKAVIKRKASSAK